MYSIMTRPYICPSQALINAEHGCHFFCDHPDYSQNTPEALKSCGQYDLLTSRIKLREFCRENKIAIPAGTAAEQFARISAWAVKTNRFPMAIKTGINLCDGEASFVLKAFRELPEFYERITADYPGAVILEELLNPKARIELTCLNAKIRMATQIGLEKSLLLRHVWRAFPVVLPAVIMQQIKIILSRFSRLLEVPDVPIRFSFAIKADGPVLISVNAGFNRPEYFLHWRAEAGLPPLAECEYQSPVGRFGKLLFFSGFSGNDADADKLRQLCSTTFVKYAAAGDQITVFLCSDKAATLLEDSKKVDAFFKHQTG